MINSMHASFAVEDRLQIGREHATVRYVGEVIGQLDVWIGLEWDDPSRGKHDGSTGGHQYFKCVFAGTNTYITNTSCYH